MNLGLPCVPRPHSDTKSVQVANNEETTNDQQEKTKAHLDLVSYI